MVYRVPRSKDLATPEKVLMAISNNMGMFLRCIYLKCSTGRIRLEYVDNSVPDPFSYRGSDPGDWRVPCDMGYYYYRYKKYLWIKNWIYGDTLPFTLFSA